MATDHFGFTKLVVGDLEKCASFYKSVCELTEHARVDASIDGRPISEIIFNPTQGATAFVLLTFVGAAAPQADEVILGFITPSVDAFVARARAAGGSVVQEAVNQPEHGVRVAFVRDVEGHLIEVVETLPPA